MRISSYNNVLQFKVTDAEYTKLLPVIQGVTVIDSVLWRKNWKTGKVERVPKVDYYYKYDPKTNIITMPIGWIDDICIAFKELGIEIEHNDTEYLPAGCSTPVTALSQALYADRYKFQDEAVLVCIDKVRGILKHPTGAGKTITMLKLINQLALSSLIIVPNLTLYKQTYNKFVEYLGEDKVGQLAEGVWEFKRVNIATVQTLWSAYKNGRFADIKNHIDVLILDEAHHTNTSNKGQPSNSWFKLAAKIPAYYRFGFTATPGDGAQFKLLKGAVGDVIHEMKIKDLIALKVLVGADVKMYKVKVDNDSYKWHEAFDNLISSSVRNSLIAKIARDYQREGKRVLIITNRIEKQSKILHTLLPASKFLHGGTKAGDRIDAINGIEINNHILIGTIFGEGTDIPSIDVVIIASGGKSAKTVLQRLGRGLRTYKGKDRVIIVDFYDMDGALLLNHSKKRQAVYESEEAFTFELCEESDEFI